MLKYLAILDSLQHQLSCHITSTMLGILDHLEQNLRLSYAVSNNSPNMKAPTQQQQQTKVFPPFRPFVRISAPLFDVEFGSEKLRCTAGQSSVSG